MNEKNWVQKKNSKPKNKMAEIIDEIEKIYETKQDKQRAGQKTPEEVRRFIDSYGNFTLSQLLAVFDAYSSRPSSRSQKQKQPIKTRPKKSNKSLS